MACILTGRHAQHLQSAPPWIVQYCSLQVISAFDVPKMLYEPVRKCFYQAAMPPKLLAAAEVHACPLPLTTAACQGCGLTAETAHSSALVLDASQGMQCQTRLEA